MKNYLLKYKDRDLAIPIIMSWILFTISMFVNFIASTYASKVASVPVTDIILSNVRVFDVDFIFNYGPIFIILLVLLIVICEPKRMPFVVESVALFIFIRSIFISLTHIAPFPTQAAIDTGSGLMSKLTFSGDLFFSGHTGIPFLLALIFWNNKKLRCVFLFCSIFMGIVVLLGHYHYSIDVLSAFFITYTIFDISSHIFKKDKKLLLSTI